MSQGELFSQRAVALARGELPFGAQIAPRLMVAVLHVLREKLPTLTILLEFADTPEAYCCGI